MSSNTAGSSTSHVRGPAGCSTGPARTTAASLIRWSGLRPVRSSAFWTTAASDEAFYLKAAWTDEPTVHICGPYNGEVWVYSNCDAVRLSAGGKSLGKKEMPEDGHLVWKVSGTATSFTATGYIKGRKAAVDEYPSIASGTVLALSKSTLKADGQDVVVIDIDSPCETLDVEVSGATFLGWGNGNPGFKEVERPVNGKSMTIKPFSGKAQVIVRSIEGASSPVTVKVGDKTAVIGME